MVADSTLGVAVLLLCHVILPWCWLVCLSQFKICGEVSAFIEYVWLKIPLLPHQSEQRTDWTVRCDWMGCPKEVANHFLDKYKTEKQNILHLLILYAEISLHISLSLLKLSTFIMCWNYFRTQTQNHLEIIQAQNKAIRLVAPSVWIFTQKLSLVQFE